MEVFVCSSSIRAAADPVNVNVRVGSAIITVHQSAHIPLARCSQQVHAHRGHWRNMNTAPRRPPAPSALAPQCSAKQFDARTA